ncbi:fec operon regulator FecR [compost metagenome]
MSDFQFPAADPSMTTCPDSDLNDDAIDWLVLLNSGNATAQDHARYQRWCQLSPAHAAAAEDAQALWGDLGHTVAASTQAVPQRRARTQRWRALAAAAVMALVGYGGWQQAPALLADYHTGVGQRQTLTLSDGSKVTLNSASALSVQFSAGQRKVLLKAGEALFEPTVEAGRPFVVEAGDAQVQGAGAQFSVRREGSRMTVVVAQGQAQVSGRQPAVLLHSNQRLQQGGQADTVDARAVTAWQRGKLIFNGSPLGEVIAELERYQHGRILISDGQLSALQVSGVFDLDDPQGMLRTLEQRYPVKVTYLPWLAVLH